MHPCLLIRYLPELHHPSGAPRSIITMPSSFVWTQDRHGPIRYHDRGGGFLARGDCSRAVRRRWHRGGGTGGGDHARKRDLPTSSSSPSLPFCSTTRTWSPGACSETQCLWACSASRCMVHVVTLRHIMFTAHDPWMAMSWAALRKWKLGHMSMFVKESAAESRGWKCEKAPSAPREGATRQGQDIDGLLV